MLKPIDEQEGEMGKKGGSYLGGSTIIRLKRKGKRRPEDHALSYHPPLSAEEERLKEVIKQEMLGKPGLITKEKMEKLRARSKTKHRLRQKTVR